MDNNNKKIKQFKTYLVGHRYVLKMNRSKIKTYMLHAYKSTNFIFKCLIISFLSGPINIFKEL